MKNNIMAVLICCLALSAFGCTTMTIEGDGQKTPTSKTGTHTVHGSYYDFVWSAPPEKVCDNGRGLYRVRYHTNALYALVSILSLGFYVPQTAQWWCDGTPARDDNEPIYHPRH